MRSFKRITSGVSSAILVLSSLMTLGFTGVAHAAAQTCTWTGTAGDNKFSTATNWSNCNSAAPVAGDIVSFGTLSANQTLTNDLSVALGGVVATTNGSASVSYTVNTLTLAAGATIDASQANGGGTVHTSLLINSLTAQGALTITGSGVYITNSTLGGALTLGDGASFGGASVGSAGVTVQNGAMLTFNSSSPSSNHTYATPSYPITLGGGSGTAEPIVRFQPDLNGSDPVLTTWNFGNPLALVGNAYVLLDKPQTTVNQTGSINGAGFVLALSPASVQGSTVNFSPSSNNSNTVAGSQSGKSIYTPLAGAGGAGDTAPGTPDTGFAYASSHPAAILGLTVVAAGIIVAIARSKRLAAPARAKASRR